MRTSALTENRREAELLPGMAGIKPSVISKMDEDHVSIHHASARMVLRSAISAMTFSPPSYDIRDPNVANPNNFRRKRQIIL
ncbi:MAG TPA: hypothetical protein VNA15_03955 [Candidatus Angelobacter sp.]|nr:hypothetical protein [Candidatus Angelobacter sp.]